MKSIKELLQTDSLGGQEFNLDDIPVTMKTIDDKWLFKWIVWALELLEGIKEDEKY